MALPSNGGPHPDPAIRRILEELRDLRVEMRAGREADRKQTEADRKQADADRKQADADRRRAEIDRKQAEVGRRRSDERFEQLLRESREDSLLERIDRKLGVPRQNGRGA